MKEFVEKLIEKISNKKDYFQRFYECEGKTEHDADLNKATQLAFDDCLRVIEQLAEEYKDKHNDHDLMIVESLPSLYPLQDFEVEAIHRLVSRAKYNNGWISVEDRLPEDCDNRFYMCIVENHEEDLPMFCQYDEEYGFGFWHDIYDEHTLGFVDSEFKTNEELGYEKVIAWQPLPGPYIG